jgi:hypothetical protein
MEKLLVEWAGDVNLGFDLQEFEACTYILCAYVVILSNDEIKLPKVRVFDRINCNTS